MENLGNNSSDRLASAVKSLAGIVPYVGATLGEIVSSFIPNQRMDRIIKYLQSIDEKVEILADDIKNNKEKINLVETGLRFSATATFDEKCQWIANIVKRGLENTTAISIADDVISIVSELNYEQVVILYYYVTYHNEYRLKKEEKSKFISRFTDLFNFEKLFLIDNLIDKTEFDELKIKKSFNMTTLVKLGLLENEVGMNNLRYSTSSIDSWKKEIQKLRNELAKFYENNYRASELGRLVISTMELTENSLQLNNEKSLLCKIYNIDDFA